MIDFDNNLYYGYPEECLSMTQVIKALRFSITVEPWLLENIGEFGVKWFVAIDEENNSFKLFFSDKESEMTYMLGWQYGAKSDYDKED